MNANKLPFPILTISDDDVLLVENNIEYLTTTTSLALRRGFFGNLRIIDVYGKEYVVKTAKKLRGIGPFWGFNIFLGRKIQVDIDIEETGNIYPIEEIRKWVLREIHGNDIWESRGDFDGLIITVKNAKTIADMIQPLSC